jgi:hypothetical protein
MFLDGFDLLDRIRFVHIVMVLIVPAYLGVSLHRFSWGHSSYLLVVHLPKRHMMCIHFESFTGFLCTIVTA